VSEEPAVIAAIVHDMAGMLSNVAAFAEILVGRPDHPSRDEFIPVMAKEARSATEALKDLQLARSLSEPWSARDLQRVELHRVLQEAESRLSRPGYLRAVLDAAQEGPAGTFIADEGVFVGLLTRALNVASGGGPDQTAPIDVDTTSDAPRVTLNLSETTYEGDVAADVERGRRELRAFALLRGVVGCWGGSSELTDADGTLRLTLSLPPS
jgi:hypothetical protein